MTYSCEAQTLKKEEEEAHSGFSEQMHTNTAENSTDEAAETEQVCKTAATESCN